VRNNIHKLIKIQDEHGNFNAEGYKSLTRMTKLFNQKSMFVKRKHVLNNLSHFLRENNMLPAIAFVFSRKMVEQYAAEITVPLLEDDSKVPYNVSNECEQIVRKLPNFKEYLELPEYNTLVKLLEKGIGIHHSGMIPILREIVEIMISKNYIKLLFATESFAIGLDCPIKTAIFTSTTKFDGRGQRTLLSHEYTQMAGRAGRRGIDKIGHVVHCNNLFNLPLQNDYELMLNGNPQSLISKFRISYGLVFNLIKNGKFTIGEFSDFIYYSMISSELRDEIKHQQNVVQDLIKSHQKMEEKTLFLKTIPIVCKRYIEICNTIQYSKNKQRKQLEKEQNRILDENPNCKNDAKFYEEFDKLNNEIQQAKEQLYFLENFVQDKLESLCEVLIQEEFITKKEDNYMFCEKGEISSNIAEIHPLIISKLLLHNEWFSSMNVNEIAATLSLFTDVNVDKEEKTTFPQSDNKQILNSMVYLQEQFEYFDTIEQNSHIHSGLEYDDVLCFDMPELVEKWCDCEDERQCKFFLQNDAAQKGISPGDFTKALLKISNIVRELSVCAEKMNQIECLHKLSQIDGKILKYITTSQSLYV
jgi:superfamily II RNA helicase